MRPSAAGAVCRQTCPQVTGAENVIILPLCLYVGSADAIGDTSYRRFVVPKDVESMTREQAMPAEKSMLEAMPSPQKLR